MSDKIIWYSVCSSESQTSFDVTRCVRQNRCADPRSPIDTFYAQSRDLIKIGTLEQFEQHPAIGKFLLLGLVATAETYFRSALAQVANLCPLARERLKDEKISMGHVSDYGIDNLGYSLFAEQSLASKEKIMAETKRICGISISKKTTPSLDEALHSFGRLCQLRHAVAHTSGFLSRGNCERIALPQREHFSYAVHVTLQDFHGAVEACYSVVRSFNRSLFKEIITAWIGRGGFPQTWNIDKGTYGPLFRAFRSTSDGEKPSRPYDSYRMLQSSVNVRNK